MVTMRILLAFLACGSAFGLQADLNNDEIVDFRDLAILASEWLQPDQPQIGMQNSPSPQVVTWYDDSAMASKHRAPRLVFNRWLIGGDSAEMATYGINIFDGQFTKTGGKLPAGLTLNHMWGIVNCGIFCQATLANANQILKSNTGFDDFRVVLEPKPINRSCLARSLVDCGRHVLNAPNDSYGNVDRRVLIYLEYTDNKDGLTPPRIWYSAEPNGASAGDTGTWHDLFGADSPAIRHFHGGIYVQGKGLYVFTGDAGNKQASILFCSKDDFNDLIENSTTWYHTYWQLGAGDRAGWSGPISTDHILTGNTLASRTVELVTADSKVGYYIPDNDPLASGNSIIRVNFYDTSRYACGSSSYLKHNGIQNFGWYGGASKTGLVYLSTIGYWGTTDFVQNNNRYCEIWCIDSKTEEFGIVKRIPRQDYDPVRGLYPADNVGAGLARGLLDYGGSMFGRLGLTVFSYETGDTDYFEHVFCGSVLRQEEQP
jgi:hypothetical protein